MWIVKLGGSLLGSPELNEWLEVLAHHGDGKVVIVPGGGLLADAVRESQRMSGCSDLVAHKMAVMAMDQFGVLMSGLNSELVTASNELEIAERGWQHRAIVWLPSEMVLADETIPTNWQVTSDSLAAWLASKLNAEHLILVKSERLDLDQISLERLTKEGFVDEHFGDYIVGKTFNTWVLGKQDHNIFHDKLSEEILTETGLPVMCSWN
ncbi:uridylate kinase [Methylovorus sp. MM2]|uniref:amino acid kinase family protein n=1 Tax=Methylovorus sp. MM2 TaxID=1848038 RepID=UPI0007E02FE1|nr:uridylate kinase [Methylovorus sp. MM2]OAM52891.1 uridylate kinase [Methylovorus sp. MM2]